jgi:phage baseplate assembly protein V
MLDIIDKMTAGARNRIGLIIGRCILRAVNDAGGVQLVQAQLLADELQDDMERIQQYGYTSVPLPGAEGVAVFAGGNRDHGLVIAVEDRRYRLKGLKGGEVALYDDLGHKVHLTRDGIVIDGAGQQVTITNTPKTRIESDLDVTGEIKDLCDSGGKTMSGMRNVYNGHDHPGDSGGTTGTPNAEM